MNGNLTGYNWLGLIIDQINPAKSVFKPGQVKDTEGVIFALKSAKQTILEELKQAEMAIIDEVILEQYIKKSYNIIAGLSDELKEIRGFDGFESFNLASVIEFAEKTLDELQKHLLRKYKLELAGIQHDASKNTAKDKEVTSKVILELSGDQIALLLRAAQENGVLLARSVTAVFKTIVPHLSTAQQETLSPTLRSKAYQAEDRDKEILINILMKLVASIKSY